MTCCCNQAGCCLSSQCLMKMANTLVSDGTCDSCDFDVFGTTDYRLYGGTIGGGNCVWVNCSEVWVCNNYYAGQSCLPNPVLVTTLTIEPSVTTGWKATLEFLLVPEITCDTPRVIALYEKDEITAVPCSSFTVDKVSDDGSCTFPASIAIATESADENECPQCT